MSWANKRIRFSGSQLDADEIAKHHRIVTTAIHLYYKDSNPEFEATYGVYTPEEVITERNWILDEVEAASSMIVFASIEAALQVDYLVRCRERYRDDLSCIFRALYRDRGSRVSLMDDLLEIWRRHSQESQKLLNDIRLAVGYRNWLAHGRYWQPKFGRVYDFMSVYHLAQGVESMLSSNSPRN